MVTRRRFLQFSGVTATALVAAACGAVQTAPAAEEQAMEEKEVRLGTRGGGKVEGQVMEESDIDSEVEFDDEFIEEYWNNIDMPRPMTISKELFYSDKMVAKRYEKLSDEDKIWHRQTKGTLGTMAK